MHLGVARGGKDAVAREAHNRSHLAQRRMRWKGVLKKRRGKWVDVAFGQ
jgi:hypothetical protein